MDFLLVVIGLFVAGSYCHSYPLGATINSKSAFFKQVGQFGPKF